MKKRSLFLRTLVILFAVLALVGLVVWEFFRNPIFENFYQAVQTKIYNARKLTSLSSQKNYQVILDTYTPSTDFDDFVEHHFPPNVIIQGKFPDHVKRAIYQAVFDTQKILPVKDLGDI